MSVRTFVVTVSDSPSRVVVEDVRHSRRALAGDLASVGREIAELLDTEPKAPSRAARQGGVPCAD